ncbi:uncharacterized protein BX663DRAFT_487850 [Cokeromyces recurvatus]|uniref:uncharacterized protein n=1 Tax=Cokeromyces recurvatus TaxID=90255 RepID=UPI00221F7DFF|nr:uncharacterized protein BX663DRAFT_487850 [Cokeromyces recurvatus]KAI7901282.1 hypothetical protein BX663DRAFT_487850 [Cokeromyces recurvatus]
MQLISGTSVAIVECSSCSEAGYASALSKQYETFKKSLSFNYKKYTETFYLESIIRIKYKNIFIETIIKLSRFVRSIILSRFVRSIILRAQISIDIYIAVNKRLNNIVVIIQQDV